MKVYKFEIIIREQSDEFYEEITADGKSGCDEVLLQIKEDLSLFDADIRLIGYEEK
jgi:hypothetical protein